MRVLQIKYILFAIPFIVAFSCKRVVVKVTDVPSNTPRGAQIYIAGNFNLWDPGDANYAMTLNADSSYSFQLPRVLGRVEYKFTRGDWSASEGDRCGNEIGNRFFEHVDVDTLTHTIDSWRDLDPVNCDSVTIIVDKIPNNTPPDDTLKIAGSFNAWNPGVKEEYFLRLDSNKNQYKVTVPRVSHNGKSNKLLTYKFVRKDISVAETDEFGREIDPRVLNFEKGDTVKVEIKNWNDLIEKPDTNITIILTSIPKNTPALDNIYLVGNFNNWNPKDANYKFKKNKEGLYEINLKRQRYGLSFKITRGAWDKEFTDKCGYKLSNLDFNYDEIDTLLIDIGGWLDIKNNQFNDVVLIVNKYPENTPPDTEIKIMNKEISQFFNFESYTLQKGSNNWYYTTLTKKELNYDFVFTRGDYITQEVDNFGNLIYPRNISDNCDDSLFFQINQWNDLVKDDQMVRIVITKLPKRTPKNHDVFIVGRFNGWNPSDKNFILKPNNKGQLYIDIPKRWLSSGFKFTRGSWKSVEGNSFGSYRKNRYYKGNETLIELKILTWEDKLIF